MFSEPAFSSYSDILYFLKPINNDSFYERNYIRMGDYDLFEKKPKKKKHHHDYDDNGYDHKKSLEIADQMENFLTDASMMLIFVGKKYSKVKEAKKVIKKMIKDLREGKEDKVFDEEEYEKYLSKYE